MSRPHELFAVIVTEGVALEYPPELYETRSQATLEAERWAWILSGTGWLEVERPFDGRWTVGERDVRLLRVVADRESRDGYWIGQYWTKDGVPDPEALMLGSRDEAQNWVMESPPGADSAIETIEMPWFLSATYRFGEEEAYAVASLAKFVAG